MRRSLVATLIAALVLTSLPPGERLAPPAQAMQGIRPCSNLPSQIIQNCKLGGNGELELETLVINDLLKLHKLPASDRDRLKAWERDKIRAGIYERLISYIRKPAAQRSADEQAIVTGLANKIKARRVLAATKAIDEFDRWLSNCPYTPPPGFAPYLESCELTLGQLFSGRTAPSFEQFQAYGAYLAASELQTDPEMQRSMRNVAQGLGLLGGLVATGVASAAGAVIGVAAAGTVANALFPFASGAAGGISTLVGAVSIAGPVAALLFCIVVSVIRGIQVFEQAEIPNKLQQAKTDAENITPDLAQLITTETGLREVFAEVMLATFPEFPPTSGVPAAQASDPKFEVSPSGLNTFTATPSLQYKDWDGAPHTLRLNGRWFVDRKGNEPERLTLSIEYLDAEGKKRLASRIGSDFLIVDVTSDNEAPIKSAELRYLNWNGEGYVALIPDSPPTIAAATLTTGLARISH